MYNEYIYEKKLKEEKLKKIEHEKMIKYLKIHIKKTDKLSNNYYEKIKFFILNSLNNSDFNINVKSNFSNKKNNGINSDKEINNKKKIKKNNLNKNIRNYKSSNNINNKRVLSSVSQLSNNEDNSLNHFELPKMRYSPKNDLERIIDSMYYNSGKEVDLKYVNKLNEKYKKKINKRVFNFLKGKINTNKNDISYSINNIYPLSINESTILKNAQEKEESKEDKNYLKLLKYKIINSKIIKDITFNEKYKFKTFYGTLRYSLLDRLINNRINSEPKLNKLHLSPSLKSHKKTKKEIAIASNLIKSYHNDIKKFNEFNRGLKNIHFKKEFSEESSDSSIHDNGQEEVLKKVISLNYPILSELDEKKIEKNKKKLNYLKNLLSKENKKEESIQQKFSHRNAIYLNYLKKRKNYEYDKIKRIIIKKGNDKNVVFRDD